MESMKDDGFCGDVTECGPGVPCSAPQGNLRPRFAGGTTWTRFLEQAVVHRDLWLSLTKRAQVSDATLVRARALPRRWHALILSDDWCGDSLSTLPFLARLTELTSSLDMRIVSRDANLDLMDSHLTGTSRAIPVVLLLDDTYCERAWWGPRPAPLQTMMMGEWKALPKEERYRLVRGWYARDRGATALDEIVTLLERQSALAAGSLATQATAPASGLRV